MAWAFSYVSDDGEWDFTTDPNLTALSVPYTFTAPGEYDVKVTVTDNAGKSSEGWFHVVVDAATPVATVNVSGPTNEGQPVTFTLTNFGTDLLSAAWVSVNWTGATDESGAGVFEAVPSSAIAANADGSLSFTHVYTAVAGDSTYEAVVRLEDFWGEASEYAVAVAVKDVKPSATLVAGTHAALVAFGGKTYLDLRAVLSGLPLSFVNPLVASSFDASQLTYHWEVNGEESDAHGPVFQILAGAASINGKHRRIERRRCGVSRAQARAGSVERGAGVAHRPGRHVQRRAGVRRRPARPRGRPGAVGRCGADGRAGTGRVAE